MKSGTKVEAKHSAKRLVFRSKTGKVVLILPIEDVNVVSAPGEM